VIVRESIAASTFASILDESKATENCIQAGKFLVGKKHYHLYIIPIWFGEEWLGYIGIFTERKLGKLFRAFLSDFENNYVDDQLKHVLNFKNRI
jgi:hypothetical protein